MVYQLEMVSGSLGVLQQADNDTQTQTPAQQLGVEGDDMVLLEECTGEMMTSFHPVEPSSDSELYQKLVTSLRLVGAKGTK